MPVVTGRFDPDIADLRGNPVRSPAATVPAVQRTAFNREKLHMLKTILISLAVMLGWAAGAFGQAVDTPFHVHDANGLSSSDATMTITNTGGTSYQSLCANIYAYAGSQGGTLSRCCTCLVAPNAIRKLSIGTNLGFLGDSAIIQMLASTGVGGVCDASIAGGDNLAIGLVAWMAEKATNTPIFAKSAFLPVTLSATELANISAQCAILTSHPCPSCP